VINRANMRSHNEGEGVVRKALRLALIAGVVLTAGFAVPHSAHAQGNTDDAHELCAQGGGEDDSGTGGSGGSLDLNELDNMSDSELAAIGNGTAGSDDEGGHGGGGAGGGLGGAEGVGGGAGGCARDVSDRVPHRRIIERPIVRRTRNLPITGGAAENVAYMGGAFVLAGGALLTANRRRARLEQAASEGFVWDAFGGTRIPLGRGSFSALWKKD
jgi:hypothetical protein